jgi:hypothetical protein
MVTLYRNKNLKSSLSTYHPYDTHRWPSTDGPWQVIPILYSYHIKSLAINEWYIHRLGYGVQPYSNLGVYQTPSKSVLTKIAAFALSLPWRGFSLQKALMCSSFPQYQQVRLVIAAIAISGSLTCGCKGNLTDLRRILHLSLAKGNPK